MVEGLNNGKDPYFLWSLNDCRWKNKIVCQPGNSFYISIVDSYRLTMNIYNQTEASRVASADGIGGFFVFGGRS